MAPAAPTVGLDHYCPRLLRYFLSKVSTMFHFCYRCGEGENHSRPLSRFSANVMLEHDNGKTRSFSRPAYGPLASHSIILEWLVNHDVDISKWNIAKIIESKLGLGR